MHLILVAPATIEMGSTIKPVRCPVCKSGRICDAIDYKDVIRTLLMPSIGVEAAIVLKCPHCKTLVSVTVLKIE